jgi:hypothetical protein
LNKNEENLNKNEEVSGRKKSPFGHVKNFLKHQRIDRPKPSIIKPLCVVVESSSIPPIRVEEESPLEGKGKERKGKERKGGASSSIDEGVEFSSFWFKYPRKQSKKDALKAFAKVQGVKHIAAILAAIEKCEFPDDPKFIPLPATWLNREPWKYDATPSPGFAEKKEGGAQSEGPEGDWQQFLEGDWQGLAWADLPQVLQQSILTLMAIAKKRGES